MSVVGSPRLSPLSRAAWQPDLLYILPSQPRDLLATVLGRILVAEYHVVPSRLQGRCSICCVNPIAVVAVRQDNPRHLKERGYE